MRFYTQTITVPKGHHLVAQLPDGSTVDLNADTKLSYHPYWWRFARTVNFEGEGFFKVKKGKKLIERQYNVRILFQAKEDYFYTGFFSRDKQVEEVLDLLAKTFGFTFVKRSDNEYEIIQTTQE